MIKNEVNDSIIYDLMLRLLINEYEVRKIKSGKRFKRGINIGGINYFLPKQKYHARKLLFDRLYGLYAPERSDVDLILRAVYGF
jgi:hypothetical protein